MAQKGIGYFDSRGQFFKTPEDATVSDLSRMLGKIGEGESLAPGIAHMILDRRGEIERIFAEHDAMAETEESLNALPIELAANVSVLPKPSALKKEKAS